AAQWYSAPAGRRPAMRGIGPSILPGGRLIIPFGHEYPTGPGAFGLAVSASGKTVITSNGGPQWNSLTVAERNNAGAWQSRQFELDPPERAKDVEDDAWRSVFMG